MTHVIFKYTTITTRKQNIFLFERQLTSIDVTTRYLFTKEFFVLLKKIDAPKKNERFFFN